MREFREFRAHFRNDDNSIKGELQDREKQETTKATTATKNKGEDASFKD